MLLNHFIASNICVRDFYIVEMKHHIFMFISATNTYKENDNQQN